MLGAFAGIIELTFVGGAEGLLAAMDVARARGWPITEVSDFEAETERVRRANRDELVEFAFDRPIPFLPQPVRCAGLKAISPNSGSDLKSWMAARIAHLWRRRNRRWLFEYRTRSRVRLRDGSRGSGSVLKKQRWETTDFVDLDVGDSPAHLSGIGGGKMRGVAGPRREAVDDQADDQLFTNHALDFGETV